MKDWDIARCPNCYAKPGIIAKRWEKRVLVCNKCWLSADASLWIPDPFEIGVRKHLEKQK